MSDEELMALAAELGAESVRLGRGGPFGAVIARDGEVLATGQNRVLATGDPTAHAEIEAIRHAAAARFPDTLTLVPRPAGSDDPAAHRSRMLMGYTIYASGFPCPMCMSAIYWARLDGLVFACDVEDARGIGFDDAQQYQDFRRPVTARRIPVRQVGRADGLAAFALWDSTPDRHPY
jgi:guanine deaminase